MCGYSVGRCVKRFVSAPTVVCLVQMCAVKVGLVQSSIDLVMDMAQPEGVFVRHILISKMTNCTIEMQLVSTKSRDGVSITVPQTTSPTYLRWELLQ
jgi:hypothetical protein